MALFRWKKGGDGETTDTGGDGSSGKENGQFQPQPEKAAKWFEYARNAADTYNYEYALTCYANGIKLDPESMKAHEEMLEVAVKYMNKGGKAASSREIRQIADDTPVSRFAAAEFAWMKDYRNASLAMKALESAVKAEQWELAHWIAPKALGLVRSQKKVSKSMLLQLKDVCKEAGAWDQAIQAGELALQLDPRNSELAHEIKDLSAQRAMDQGGYADAAGQEGGFRKYIKDADRQRELIESEAIATSETVEERNLERARAEYQQNPASPEAIGKYGQLLKKKGTPEAIKEAYEVYSKGFKETREYRFRMLAGDVKIESLRRKVRQLQEKLEENPDDDELKEELKQARKTLLDVQAEEYAERIKKYPTDRHRKFEYGLVLYELGRFEEAMGQFQSAKEEPKLRVRASHLLGKCFAAEEWHPEAVAEFKEALNAIEVIDKDRELNIRYDLMTSLLEQARVERSLDIAREALEICSGIARRNITFRDIRAKRKEIDQVVKDLSQPAGGEESS